jgi:hypothetical protein
METRRCTNKRLYSPLQRYKESRPSIRQIPIGGNPDLLLEVSIIRNNDGCITRAKAKFCLTS